MKKFKRELLAGCLALISGCVGLPSSDNTESPENTETVKNTDMEHEEDYSITDLRINNRRDQTVTVTVTLIPDGDTEPSLELSVRLPPEGEIEWEDNPLLDDPGRVTVTVENGSSEPEQDEDDWRGDTIDDNRELLVLVGEEGIKVRQPVA